jgi:hypothetical protein
MCDNAAFRAVSRRVRGGDGGKRFSELIADLFSECVDFGIGGGTLVR